MTDDRSVAATKQHRGRKAFLSGQAAEDLVARHYQHNGYSEAARRWRSKAGEIDLIFRRGREVCFVEVKASASFDRAANQLGKAQMARIFRAAEMFLGDEPAGTLTPSRIDVALVNTFGQVQIVENAFGGC